MGTMQQLTAIMAEAERTLADRRPRRPSSAFDMFSNSVQRYCYTDGNATLDMAGTRNVAQAWNSLPALERAPYEKSARIEMQRYLAQQRAYDAMQLRYGELRRLLARVAAAPNGQDTSELISQASHAARQLQLALAPCATASDSHPQTAQMAPQPADQQRDAQRHGSGPCSQHSNPPQQPPQQQRDDRQQSHAAQHRPSSVQKQYQQRQLPPTVAVPQLFVAETGSNKQQQVSSGQARSSAARPLPLSMTTQHMPMFPSQELYRQRDQLVRVDRAYGVKPTFQEQSQRTDPRYAADSRQLWPNTVQQLAASLQQRQQQRYAPAPVTDLLVAVSCQGVKGTLYVAENRVECGCTGCAGLPPASRMFTCQNFVAHAGAGSGDNWATTLFALFNGQQHSQNAMVSVPLGQWLKLRGASIGDAAWHRSSPASGPMIQNFAHTLSNGNVQKRQMDDVPIMKSLALQLEEWMQRSGGRTQTQGRHMQNGDTTTTLPHLPHPLPPLPLPQQQQPWQQAFQADGAGSGGEALASNHGGAVPSPVSDLADVPPRPGNPVRGRGRGRGSRGSRGGRGRGRGRGRKPSVLFEADVLVAPVQPPSAPSRAVKPAAPRVKPWLDGLNGNFTPVFVQWSGERCAACNADSDLAHDQLLTCERCGITVHQSCYGVWDLPETAARWLCRVCETLKPGRSTHGPVPQCCLCPIVGGALKRTTVSDDVWCHVTCLQWTPEVSVDDLRRMEPITGIQGIEKDRWDLICALCKQRMGAKVQCDDCCTAFHPLCARIAGYRMEVMGSQQYSPQQRSNQIGVQLVAYCPRHKAPLPGLAGVKKITARDDGGDLPDSPDADQASEELCNAQPFPSLPRAEVPTVPREVGCASAAALSPPSWKRRRHAAGLGAYSLRGFWMPPATGDEKGNQGGRVSEAKTARGERPRGSDGNVSTAVVETIARGEHAMTSGGGGSHAPQHASGDSLEPAATDVVISAEEDDGEGAAIGGDASAAGMHLPFAKRKRLDDGPGGSSSRPHDVDGNGAALSISAGSEKSTDVSVKVCQDDHQHHQQPQQQQQKQKRRRRQPQSARPVAVKVRRLTDCQQDDGLRQKKLPAEDSSLAFAALKPAALVGRWCRMWWPEDREWYVACVRAYAPGTTGTPTFKASTPCTSFSADASAPRTHSKPCRLGVEQRPPAADDVPVAAEETGRFGMHKLWYEIDGDSEWIDLVKEARLGHVQVLPLEDRKEWPAPPPPPTQAQTQTQTQTPSGLEVHTHKHHAISTKVDPPAAQVVAGDMQDGDDVGCIRPGREARSPIRHRSTYRSGVCGAGVGDKDGKLTDGTVPQGAHAVGHRVSVFFPEEGNHLRGVVRSFKADQNLHVVFFDSGHVEWVDLSTDGVRWLLAGDTTTTPTNNNNDNNKLDATRDDTVDISAGLFQAGYGKQYYGQEGIRYKSLPQGVPDTLNVICGELCGTFDVRRVRVTVGDSGKEMTPREFEIAAGLGSGTRWKSSIRLHQADGQVGCTLESWLIGVGLDAPRISRPSSKQQHVDDTPTATTITATTATTVTTTNEAKPVPAPITSRTHLRDCGCVMCKRRLSVADASGLAPSKVERPDEEQRVVAARTIRSGKRAYVEAMPLLPGTGPRPTPLARLALSRCWTPEDWAAHRWKQWAIEDSRDEPGAKKVGRSAIESAAMKFSLSASSLASLTPPIVFYGSANAVVDETESTRRLGISLGPGAGPPAGEVVTMPERLATCALTERHRLAIGKSSIHGWGVFARVPILQESLVLEYRGDILRRAAADVRERRYEALGLDCYLFNLDHDTVLDATCAGSMARFINHSCAPSLYSKILAVDGELKLAFFARENLRPGQELTISYRTEEDGSQPVPICKCGAPTCTGRMDRAPT